MLHKVATEKPIAKVAADLEEAVKENGFGVMEVHDLKWTMHKKGVEFGPECQIFEVCNPHKAKAVLENNMAVSTALPCRISVYEENGKTILATLQPTALMTMFGEPELAPVAEDVERTLYKIMDQAALR
jgi:uncharacterized protein (DUF302 family)